MALVGEQQASAGEGRPGGLLDPRARGVEEPHERLAVPHRELTDARSLELLAKCAHRACHHGEVVSDDPDLTAVDVAMTCHHAVRWSAVGTVSVFREQAQLDERARVEQQVDTLADIELAALVLLRDFFGAAHGEILLTPRVKLADL